jgi:hypothetical protein
MNALAFLAALRPALPMSSERPCTPMTNSELRRHIKQGGVLINGVRVSPDAPVVPAEVFSLVFFPKSPNKRCTLL